MPFLDPLPRFEVASRATSCGSSSAAAANRQEIGIPNPFEDPGKPRAG